MLDLSILDPNPSYIVKTGESAQLTGNDFGLNHCEWADG